ncbi:replication-associated recombination protein A [Jatrophihabitans cynanchi]|jgi:putative ATPase|uniref:Replication-associated recombination protein A n=1 Tax=Jatrophihabitans cynanchi TaxID=2944128 RepID=A0ABY7JWG6_9ACTN|nr:replication-associated recombination protein A [Jatrophihabitans sp. SB3-54]WAX56891.1 replication-associated recombination protein A [Jatrophihabitans sp. SB3-54]
MTLFEPEPPQAEAFDPTAPLAARMRPRSLDEVVGQDHLLAPGSPLRRLVEGDAPMSLILFGPPGTGKTTLAQIVSGVTQRRFVQLSALNAGVKDVRAVIEQARTDLGRSGRQTVLFIDEIHRFSKTQQDSLLHAVEARHVTLVAATTENPFFSIVSPLLSRSLLLSLQPLDEDAIGLLVDRALSDERGLAGAVSLDEDARAHLLRIAGGDARRALTALEAAAGTAAAEQRDRIGLAMLEQAVDTAAVRYDRDGDQHYDVISAFIKSIRGSDADAALHYLARMIEAGEDPRFIARRLVVHASEDVGLADPTALLAATAAAQAVQLIGMPEARINLAQATIHLALAPKSNAVVAAIDAALADVRAGLAGTVPPALRDAHYAGAQQLGHGKRYRYPHDAAEGVLTQQYPPDELVGRDYYQPADRGAERYLAERLPRLRGVVRGTAPAERAGGAERSMPQP